MGNKLVIVGASGHGKVVADIALKLQKYDEIIFLDDNKDLKECMGFEIVGTRLDANQYIKEAEFFVAIGDATIRKKVTNQLCEMGAYITSLIHPAAVIGTNVRIEKGVVVMAGAVINSGSIIGRGCIINTCASVDHDCRLEDWVHVSVGAHISGTVNVGEGTWVGAGTTITNNVNICSDCMIGAGTVVIKDIEEAGTYVGVPVRRTK